jgi:uncharacterized metal-binding protein YceD (DUF177 family)
MAPEGCQDPLSRRPARRRIPEDRRSFAGVVAHDYAWKVSKPQFVVPLADLERGPRQVSWTIPEAWLRQALTDTEAEPRGDGELSVEFTKNGRDVMVRGNAAAALTMPCARTLEPVSVDIRPEIFLMLSPAAPIIPVVRRERARRAKARPAGDPAGQKQGRGALEDLTLSDKDAAADTYTGDQVVLDEFIREFILLDLPMSPVREDLPSPSRLAIASPSAEQGAAPIDPRLRPLAAIASRLKKE